MRAPQNRRSKCGTCTPPVQRHITGVLENTRVFDEKYPGIFQYPGFMMSHYRGIDKYPGISIKYPGIWQPVKCPGKWQLRTAKTTCGLFRRISGVLSFTDYSLSSSLMLDACNLYTALLELKKLRVPTWMAITERGQAGGGGSDHGLFDSPWSDCKQNIGAKLYVWRILK